MAKKSRDQLSRRERQIMDVIYRLGEATGADVRKHLPDPPSYSAVRAMLRLLEEKGGLKHTQRGLAFVYSPTVSRHRARKSALEHVLSTFFDGSTSQAMAALLDISTDKLSDAELDRLAAMIDDARKEGR